MRVICGCPVSQLLILVTPIQGPINFSSCLSLPGGFCSEKLCVKAETGDSMAKEKGSIICRVLTYPRLIEVCFWELGNNGGRPRLHLFGLFTFSPCP